jgi:hypothetical protein
MIHVLILPVWSSFPKIRGRTDTRLPPPLPSSQRPWARIQPGRETDRSECAELCFQFPMRFHNVLLNWGRTWTTVLTRGGGRGTEAGRTRVDPLPLCGTVFCCRRCPHRPWGPPNLLYSAYRGLFTRRWLVPFGYGTNPHLSCFYYHYTNGHLIC